MSKLKIQRNKEKIVKLLNEIIDLEYNLNLKRFNRTSEETRNIGTKKAPEIVRVKYGHWFEFFYDEAFPEDKKHAVKIERKEIIEVAGVKSNGWNKIKYFYVEDI